jgi:hypothetical protein
MHGALQLLILVAIGIAWRLVVDKLDRARIREDIATRGGTVGDITWKPFGRGWFGEKSDRIYEVIWRDAEGQPHVSNCKTSMWSGVYWNEGQPPSGAHDAAALEAENRRLREELARAREGRT